MKFKAKSVKSAVLIVALVALLIVAANYFGIGTMRSAFRLGYSGNEGWRSWSGEYSMLDGTMKHTIRPKAVQRTLRIEVVTEEGSISIEAKDADGSVIFDRDDMETSSFDVAISGKTVVYIEADRHKGSFRVEAIE